MMKKPLLFCIIILLAGIFGFSLYKQWVNFRPSPSYISDSAYLTKLYPLLPKQHIKKVSIDSLNFFYTPFPESIRAYRYASDTQILAKPNELYCLSWMISCGNIPGGSIFKNIYDYKDTSIFQFRDGYASNQLVEVIHYGWYNEPGFFYYQAKGTGIYLNLGKTLAATNKVDALRKLGLDNEQILAVSNHYVFPYPQYNYRSTYSTIKNYATQHKISFKKATTLVFQHVINNTNYKLNRIADSSSYDLTLYLLCRKKHYDTIQFTIAPNDQGGWAYEIMDCRTSMYDSRLSRWRQEKNYLKQCNPLNTSQCRPCQFKLPFKNKLYCEAK